MPADIKFWSVSYAYTEGPGGGRYVFGELMAASDWSARQMASTESRRHGSATVSNGNGLIVTYVNGSEWTSEVQP